MGLNKGPFVVSDTVSVEDPYGGEGTIRLLEDVPTVVATVDVCVKQPNKTKVSIDSMAQFAVFQGNPDDFVTFELKYEIKRNDVVIATINDEMDYAKAQFANRRHTNFPNFPIVDNNPVSGINTYDLVCTAADIGGTSGLIIGSRSLKATVFTL